jgi:hypothetical protein
MNRRLHATGFYVHSYEVIPLQNNLVRIRIAMGPCKKCLEEHGHFKAYNGLGHMLVM